MSRRSESERGAKAGDPAGKDGPAREAWALLSELVYPPPFIEIARQLGLRPPAFGTMRALDRPRPMSEIAAELRCDNSSVTAIVDALEEKGWARRRPSEQDRRVKLIELTAEGQKVRTRLVGELEKPPPWLQRLDASEQRALRDLLRRAAAD